MKFTTVFYISFDFQAVIGALLLFTTLVGQTLSSVVFCRDPEYLTALRNEVRPFYTLINDPSSDDLVPQGPCTFMNGNQIGQPKLPVHTTESWHSGMSTCPWAMHINEDMEGLRFPCRISTARLVGISTDNADIHSRRCLRVPGSKHRRNDNKLCKELQQTIPVVAKTGCRNGVYDYAIQNINITVGFTCAFVQ